MFETLILTPLDLSPGAAIFAIGVAFLAGLARGFSGFALSAIVMACLAPIIAPVSLIPICWVLELAASFLMARAGLAQANKRIVFGLLIGAVVGLPIGLMMTSSISTDASKLVALGLVIVLATVQLAKIRLPFLASNSGLLTSGFVSGVVTGLASIGGMVVALYVLASDTPARVMRASLVAYLFLGSFASAAFLIYFEMFTQTALLRSAVLIVPTLVGVVLGKMLFRPTLEPYYKPFCLSLLVSLALVGLTRTAF